MTSSLKVRLGYLKNQTLKEIFMKKILLPLLLMGSIAAAKTDTTQTLMPVAGQSELTPTLNAIGMSFNYDAALSSAKGQGTQTTVKYYYGLTDGHALGAELGFVSMKIESSYFTGFSTVESTSTSSGMSDVLLKYKGNYDLTVATLYWGLGYSISPEVSKYKSKSNNESESNVASGQSAVVVSLAAVAPVSNIKMGASVDYTGKQEGKAEEESSTGVVTKYTKTGGAGLQTRAFVEFDQLAHLNVALTDIRTWSSRSVSESGASTSSSTGSDLLGLEFSARFNVATNLDVIPQFNYYQYQNMENTGIKDAGVAFLGASARWVF
jgi:hypothetical protein